MVVQPINDTVIMTKDNENAKIRRFSYVLDDNQRNFFPASDNLGETINIKRDSVGPFGGSEDSLDQMSSLSSSSKGSNKMLNMADVDAIVQQQERSLQDISTPKPNTRHIKELWDGDGISPITSLTQQRNQTASDSEIEREDIGSGKSSTVKLTSVGSDTSLLSARNRQRNFVKNTSQQSPKRTSGRGDDFAVTPRPKFPSSNKNVNEGNGRELRDSYTNLTGSQTNLNGVPRQLKGSYTNLNPVCASLLAAAARSKGTALVPDMNQMDVTRTMEEHAGKTTHRFDDLPASKENQQVKILVNQPSSKSNQVRPSGLPRPVSMCGTGIPRPVSRIPAPRSNVRPLSSRSVAR
ncbi:uncharacterized protein LOC108743807 [Agrilus planipennis]|nr:uncharacterized protein LOC108743807 [Agrilus planipennis]